MNKLKGPELKMPDLKMPAFVNDLYLDLKERRLLPLVALVLVAIVAVPFLLASGSEPKPIPPTPGPAATASNAANLTVVRATPGLRAYSKRLRHRTPTDPFRQPSAEPELAGTKLGTKGDNGFESNEVTTSTSTTKTSNGSSTVTKETTKTPNSESTTTTTETETETNSSNGGNSGEEQGGQISLYSFAIDVKIVRTATKPDGSKETSEPEVRHEVIPPAALPSEKAQAVTYLGISPKTHNPLLLVSDAVTAIYGEAQCLSGESKCQLLEVETGFPMTFVYGENDVRYKINILKVKPVVLGHS